MRNAGVGWDDLKVQVLLPMRPISNEFYKPCQVLAILMSKQDCTVQFCPARMHFRRSVIRQSVFSLISADHKSPQ